MAEMKDAHVVEIPVDEEHQQKQQMSISAIQHHPLMEISRSPGHLLLLKLWQREEELFGRRIAAKETRLDFIRREIFQLCCFFFTFHGLFFTILFTSYSEDGQEVCRKWWIPSAISGCTSLFIAFLVQMKLCRFWKMSRQLQRERNDSRGLTRCIQELRMKGESFDLSKEPQIGKRMKSSSVEIKWRPLTCCSHYAVTICLVCFADGISTMGMKRLGPIVPCEWRTRKERDTKAKSNYFNLQLEEKLHHAKRGQCHITSKRDTNAKTKAAHKLIQVSIGGGALSSSPDRQPATFTTFYKLSIPHIKPPPTSSSDSHLLHLQVVY